MGAHMPNKRKIYSVLLIGSCLTIGQVYAEETKVVETKKDAAEVTRPDFVRNRPTIPAFLLKNKKEGTYWTGVPLVGWDPDTGFNVGAAVERYDNASKDHPLFNTAPYKRRITAGAVWAHRGFINVFSGYDEPYIMGTPYRPWGYIAYSRNKSQNYFGLGNDATAPLTHPTTGQTYSKYDDYKHALQAAANGQTYAQYDKYKRGIFEFRPAVEYALWGGLLRPQIGLGFSHFQIEDYTGNTVKARAADGSNVNATQLSTNLADDCAAGQAVGCNGGWDNVFKLALAFDNSDYAPDPMSGVSAQMVGEFATKALGSAHQYIRWTTQIVGYQSVLPKSWQKQNQVLVLAGRFMYNAHFLDAPFYSLDTLGNIAISKKGLGGFNSLRGFKANRFVGPASMTWNAEARYSFAQATLWNQHLKFGVKPFLDVGRPYDKVSDTTFKNMQFAYGGGFTLAWNIATVVNFDYAVTKEGGALYMELGHAF